MHKYHNPALVTSPRDCVGEINILFDGGINNGAFALALVTWEGEKRIGIRWNVTHREWDDADKASGARTCIGEPNSRGYPTWFILPKFLIQELLTSDGQIAEAVKNIIDEVQQ